MGSYVSCCFLPAPEIVNAMHSEFENPVNPTEVLRISTKEV